MTSAVPQDYILGPILFLACITNDLPQVIVLQVRLFADDTAINLTVESKNISVRPGPTSGLGIQVGYGILLLQVPGYTRDCFKDPLKTDYTFYGQLLESVTSARHLGWISHTTGAGTRM